MVVHAAKCCERTRKSLILTALGFYFSASLSQMGDLIAIGVVNFEGAKISYFV